MNFAKFLRTSIFIKHLWWLLLNVVQNLVPNPLTYYFCASVVPLLLFLSSVFLFLLFPFVSLTFFLLLFESWSSLFQVFLFSFSHFLPSQPKTLFILFLNKTQCSHCTSERNVFLSGHTSGHTKFWSSVIPHYQTNTLLKRLLSRL